MASTSSSKNRFPGTKQRNLVWPRVAIWPQFSHKLNRTNSLRQYGTKAITAISGSGVVVGHQLMSPMSGQMSRLGRNITIIIPDTARTLDTDASISLQSGGTSTNAHTTCPLSANFLRQNSLNLFTSYPEPILVAAASTSGWIYPMNLSRALKFLASRWL